ncbi:hypothetical protein MPER_01078, partial [Moniliophthora perniciosa FA553]
SVSTSESPLKLGGILPYAVGALVDERGLGWLPTDCVKYGLPFGRKTKKSRSPREEEEFETEGSTRRWRLRGAADGLEEEQGSFVPVAGLLWVPIMPAHVGIDLEILGHSFG